MKSSTAVAAVVVVVLIGTVTAGCAQQQQQQQQQRQMAAVSQENMELRSRIVRLEAEIAELKELRTPLTVNGLTLAPLEALPELKLTPNIKLGEPLGQGRITISGISSSGAMIQHGVVKSGSLELAGNATKATTARTTLPASTTTATTTTTPAK